MKRQRGLKVKWQAAKPKYWKTKTKKTKWQKSRKKDSLKTHSGKNEYKTQLGQHTNIENPADALILIQRLEEKCQEKASYSITETCIWLLVHLRI